MVSFDQITWMWSNGEFVEWRDANVHISTHTLHLGSGVFEALRCYETNDGPAVFRLDAHLDRLYASASIHSIDIPYTHDELAKAVLELIRYNDFSSCYIRML